MAIFGLPAIGSAINLARTGITAIPRVIQGLASLAGRNLLTRSPATTRIPLGGGATTKTQKIFTPSGAGDFLSKIKQISPKRSIQYTKDGKPYTVSTPGGTVTPKGVGEVVPFGAGTTAEGVISGGSVVPYGAGVGTTAGPRIVGLSTKGKIVGGLGLGAAGIFGADQLFKDDKRSDALENPFNPKEETVEDSIKEDIEAAKDKTTKQSFEEQYEKYKEIMGDGKENAKTQANFALMQMGLNLMSGKGDSFFEILGEAAKEPVQTLQLIAKDVAEKDRDLKAAAVARVEAKEDEADRFENDFKLAKLQQEFNQQALEDERLWQIKVTATDQAAANAKSPDDPRIAIDSNNALVNYIDTPMGQELGLQTPEGFDPNLMPISPEDDALLAYHKEMKKYVKKGDQAAIQNLMSEFMQAYNLTDSQATTMYNYVNDNIDLF